MLHLASDPEDADRRREPLPQGGSYERGQDSQGRDYSKCLKCGHVSYSAVDRVLGWCPACKRSFYDPATLVPPVKDE